LDELELRLHLLELEYKDEMSLREAVHLAQWGAPLGWLTATIAAGWIRDPISLILIGLIAWIVYDSIRTERIKHDRTLEVIRFEITDMLGSVYPKKNAKTAHSERTTSSNLPRIQPQNLARTEYNVDEIWRWALHEDTLLSNRGNLMLVAQSMLFAAYATVFSHGGLFLDLISSLGIVLATIWLYLSYAQQYTTRPLNEELRKASKLYSDITASRHRILSMSLDEVVGFWIPCLILLVWILLLLHTLPMFYELIVNTRK
jgi:hypothetical protein